MAIPKNLDSISTNLPRPQLEKVLRAVEAKAVQWIPGSSSLFAQSGADKFIFDGAQYELQENWEIVSSVTLVSGKKPIVAGLIDDLESEIVAAVTSREFDAAKAAYEKIKSLSRITASS